MNNPKETAWWTCGGSNPGPLECDSSALPAELHARADRRNLPARAPESRVKTRAAPRASYAQWAGRKIRLRTPPSEPPQGFAACAFARGFSNEKSFTFSNLYDFVSRHFGLKS